VSRIRDVYPGSKFFPSWIRIFSIPGPGSASKNLSTGIFTQKIVSKLSEIWSGLFIPAPNFFTHPGSRCQKGTESRIRTATLHKRPSLALQWSVPLQPSMVLDPKILVESPGSQDFVYFPGSFIIKNELNLGNGYLIFSVVDPDPYVFGPPGRICHYFVRIRILPSTSKKCSTLISTILWLLFDFLSVKTEVNIPSKSSKQKNFLNSYFVGILSDTVEKSRIRIRTKMHGSTTQAS
jgi:hypothetical protein